MKDNNVRTVIIKLNLGLLTPKDYLTIQKILFANDVKLNKSLTILTLIHRLCIRTRIKMTFKNGDDQDEILIFWKYDPNLATLPRFESDLISVYQEKKERKYNLLNQNKSFRLIGTNTVRLLSPPELMYLRTQIINFIDRKKELGEIELL